MGIQVRETLRFAMPVFFVLASLTLLGCASTSPYLSSSVDTRVELGESRLHEFTYVRVYQEGDDLVVYGRVEHSHGYCPAESHVDLAVLGSQQEVLETTSIPIVNRGTRRRGWFSAAFRARVAGHEAERAELRLAFHDDQCHAGPTYECGENQAAGG